MTVEDGAGSNCVYRKERRKCKWDTNSKRIKKEIQLGNSQFVHLPNKWTKAHFTFKKKK